MSATYEPAAVEAGRVDWWHEHGAFEAGGQAPSRPRPCVTREPPYAPRPARGAFAMVLPPPNVTGVLHVGHALTVTIEVRRRAFLLLLLLAAGVVCVCVCVWWGLSWVRICRLKRARDEFKSRWWARPGRAREVEADARLRCALGAR